jgi:addiction module HigA family antidote
MMARMFNPPHPASILREDVLPALGLTVSEAARQLGVSRVALSRVLNERAGISVDLARRIEAWLGIENGGRAETWLKMQIEYDLWKLEHSSPLHGVKRAVLTH